ncbi:MAG: sulfatase-like hydrolase/transferase, partial [Chloroflexi bacterium]|nr:sulfatase-like hydrolase/transferase [Chloroflexota bacterium]
MIIPQARSSPMVRFAVLLALLVALTALASCQRESAREASAPAAGQSGRPNIVLIQTDDQDAASIAYMPRLQALLVQKGLTFANAFVTYPLCCPSRASLLTGQYPHNHQNLWNLPPLGGFKKFYDEGREASTIATWLQTGGYRTALFGKYLNGYPANAGSLYTPPGWSEWAAMLDNVSTRGYFNYWQVEDSQGVYYGDRPEEYQTDVLANKVVSFIERAEADDNQPFFVYFAPFAPHSDRADNGPPIPAPRHRDAFADLKAPRTPSFYEADMSDKPRAWQQLRIPTGETPFLDHLYRSRLRSLL